MNWISYSLIYLGVGVIMSIGAYLYNRWKKNGQKYNLKILLLQVFVGPLLLLVLPLAYIGLGIEKIRDRYYEYKQERELKREKLKIKKKLGLRPDEHYLCFAGLDGEGEIECVDCGYKQEVTGFVHAIDWAVWGRQCPNCHSFLGEIYKKGGTQEDFICHKCGALVRKKDEQYNEKAPIFCPRCHSPRLEWSLLYIT